jgi:hypothetical protein
MLIIKRILSHTMPFLMLGTLIALGIALALFVAHLIVWGLLIGIILSIFVAIKRWFFPASFQHDQDERPGHRIIEHEKIN